MLKKIIRILNDRIDIEGLAKDLSKIGFSLPNKKITQRFSKLPNGFVMDSLLGIVWGKTIDLAVNYNDAEIACLKLGIRLPTDKELESLICRRYHPATIDILQGLLNLKTDGLYWTATPCIWSQDSASVWTVNLNYGFIDIRGKTNVGYILPVKNSIQ